MPFSARADRWRRLRTRAPEVLPERPVAAILAEIRANNRENRSVTGRELLGRRPRPPGYTARPKKPGARASTITSLALHTVFSLLRRKNSQSFSVTPVMQERG